MPVMDGYDTIRAIRAIDAVQAPSRSSPSPARSWPASASAASTPAPTTTCPSRSTGRALRRAAALAAARPRAAASPSPSRPRSTAPSPADAAPTPPVRRIEDSTLEGLKILVVDDDFRNIFAMTALLERGHADVIVAESGAEAIAALERTPDIDIVLMDIMMPVMDGYDTIRAIRQIERLQGPADRRRHRQGGGRRAPALPRRRSQRLRPQAGRHRRAPRGPRARGCRLAAPATA